MVAFTCIAGKDGFEEVGHCYRAHVKRRWGKTEDLITDLRKRMEHPDTPPYLTYRISTDRYPDIR